jgi:putative hemolysin
MANVTTAEALAAPRPGRGHIIDTLIEERAPRWSASPAWPLLRPALYGLLDYGKARRMADAIAPLPGRAALDFVSDLLALQVEVRGLERTPPKGPLLIVANHPTGIADGVAVFDAFKAVRPDIVFYANSDAHRVCPAFDEVLIPVEWVEEKRTRERTRVTLTMTKAAMEAGRALMVFPAGRLARKGPDGVLEDPEWMPTAVSIARKYDAAILPVHLSGPWSTLFHLFHGVSRELRDITLFHELLNKRGRPFTLTVGQPIAPEKLDVEAASATLALKAYIEQDLASYPDRPFA